MFVQTFIHKQIADVKRDFRNTYASWKKLNQSEFGTLLKITFILLTIMLFAPLLIGWQYFNYLYYALIALMILLFFTWLGYFATRLLSTPAKAIKYSLKLLNNWEVEFAYFKYITVRKYALVEYLVSGVLNWSPDRKKGESYNKWLDRLKPNQAIPIIRINYRYAKADLDYFTWMVKNCVPNKYTEELRSKIKPREILVKKYREKLQLLEQKLHPLPRTF